MNTLKKLIFFLSLVVLSSFSRGPQKPSHVVVLDLVRDTFTKKETLGRLYCNGRFIAYTLEKPWKKNQREVSCIPIGQYNCRIRLARESRRFNYKHLLVRNVPKRNYILFHRGNTEKNSHGCILTGLIRHKNSLQKSKEAHRALMSEISKAGRGIQLNISNLV